jgi:cytoskeletal protein RodZ
MLDKILGVLAMVACMLLCSASWLYQDVMARRAREEQEEVENQAAAAQDDDAENNPNRERKKRRVEFPSEVTMVSRRAF